MLGRHICRCECLELWGERHEPTRHDEAHLGTRCAWQEGCDAGEVAVCPGDTNEGAPAELGYDRVGKVSGA